MDADGYVVDAAKVKYELGLSVTGVDKYDGKITGCLAAGSKFDRLLVGMNIRQVTTMIGEPARQVADANAIPASFSSKRYRQALVYKGWGRLVFAGANKSDPGARLIWVIHSAKEQALR